jgi:dGTPase
MKVRKIRLHDSISIPSSEDRDEYEKDYARLIQAPAFRRLQGKAQVFGAGSGDYYRTRLTHSLEVSQIARELARKLSKATIIQKQEHPGLVIQSDVVECAALAHDLGHPPLVIRGVPILPIGLSLSRRQLHYST